MLYYGIKPESIGELGVLARQIRRCEDKKHEIKVKFIRPYGVAYLDQIILNLTNNKQLKICSKYSEVNQYLKQCGFKHLAKKAPYSKPFPQKEIIKIQKITGSPIEVEEKVINWIKKRVLIFLPELAEHFKKKIVKNLWEIVHNGLLHGEGRFGVSACGQFYPKMGYFELAFYDFGHGIPKLVRSFNELPTPITDSACIEWAVTKGNSTRPINESSGLGLHLLREFLRMNGGAFQISSGNGYFGQMGQNDPTPASLRNFIDGTLVNIRVVYDNNLYALKGEDL